jgi:hypothetical protein
LIIDIFMMIVSFSLISNIVLLIRLNDSKKEVRELSSLLDTQDLIIDKILKEYGTSVEILFNKQNNNFEKENI